MNYPAPHLLGAVTPCPIAVALGTGYNRFASPTGIAGLAKWEGDRLDILAVHADHPGTGQFRQFIRLAKQQFRSIRVWSIWNNDLAAILARYDFAPVTETQPDGEVLTGLRWDAL